MPGPADEFDLDPELPNGGADGSVTPPGEQSPDAAAAILEATRKGWVPKEEYTGDPKRWVDAKTFLSRGEKFNQNLQREVAQLKAQLQAFEGTRKQFVKFHEETIAAKDKQFQEAIAELRVQKSRATAEHDHEGAVALEDRIDLLKQEQRELKAVKAETAEQADPTTTTADPMDNPVVAEWVEDGNAWFKDDPKLRSYTLKVAEELIKAGETARGRKFLNILAERIKEDFPRRFREAGDPPRPGATETGGSTPRSGASAGRSERDLPEEDRKIMKELVAGGYTTKEKFLESYWLRNGKR